MQMERKTAVTFSVIYLFALLVGVVATQWGTAGPPTVADTQIGQD